MKKHSDAKLVAISFVVKNKTLGIRYSDKGCGTLWNPSKKGSGLKNVENHISSLNGKITFESEKEKGKFYLDAPEAPKHRGGAKSVFLLNTQY